MTKQLTQIITLQALTFLHPGSGQTTGVVDLPVQREVYSGHPMYASSGLKGSLRDKAEQKWGKNSKKIKILFGTDANEEETKSSAGSIAVTDGRILAFPVRSLQKVFVWVTCPMVINRLLRDAALVKLPLPEGFGELDNEEDKALVQGSANFKDPLVLEEVTYKPETNEKVSKIAGAINNLVGDNGFDPQRLVVIGDEDFTYFVQYATQVSARIKLNERKTTTGDGGNLWYEETLPPETILYGFVLYNRPRSDNEDINIKDAKGVKKTFNELCSDNYLQIGGNETVGQGWCHINLYGGNGNAQDS